MEQNEIKRIGSFYLIGTLFNKGIGFLTVPIFTRLLPVSDYGIVTTYNSWVVILSIVMSLALYMGIRSSFIDYQDNTKDFLSVILTFTCIYGLALLMFILIIAFFVKTKVGLGLLLLCLLQSLSVALIDDVSMFFMMRRQYKARTVVMVLPNFLSTLIAIVAIRFFIKDNLYLGRIIPNAIITVLFALGVLAYGLRGSKVRYNKDYLKYALSISVPLVLHGLALNILSQSDRTMISAIRNTTETGIYGLIYNYSMIATVLTTAFDGIWVPFFTEKMKKDEYEVINKSANKYVEFMTLAMICVVLLGPEIIKVLARQDYWEGITIIPPIVLSNFLIFVYTLYVNIEHFYKKTIFISINTASAALINIILNVVFIRKWGYIGAAYSTLLSYLFSLILHYVFARKLNAVLFPIINILQSLFIVILSVAVFYFFTDLWLVRWGISLLCLICFVLKEKEMIINILRKR